MGTLSLIEITGYISRILLAICGAPLAIRTFIRGQAKDIDSTFLVLWGAGELLGLLYTVSLSKIPLILNYMANTIFISIVIFYKLCPRKEKGDKPR